MTQIALAAKDSVPQIYGPFTVTAAALTAGSGGGYAAGVPVFTPPAGALLIASWSKVTETWNVTDTGTGTGIDDDGASSNVPAAFGTGSTGDRVADNTIGVVGDAPAEIRVHVSSTFAADAGATDIWFLVAPSTS